MSCLITSDALTAILCANSATVMVSGTWTSSTRTSVGAASTISSRDLSLPRLPRAPLRQLVLRPAPAPVSPRVGSAFFLAGSPAQLLDSLADLTSLPATPPAGAATVPGAPGLAGALATVLPVAGLCKVPLIAAFGGSGFLATITGLAGADIIMRIAAASASALRLRSPKSTARAVSASAMAFESATALAAAATLTSAACVALAAACSTARAAACVCSSAFAMAAEAACSAFTSTTGTILFPTRAGTLLTAGAGTTLATGTAVSTGGADACNAAASSAVFCAKSRTFCSCSSRKRRFSDKSSSC